MVRSTAVNAKLSVSCIAVSASVPLTSYEPSDSFNSSTSVLYITLRVLHMVPVKLTVEFLLS